MRAAYTLGEPRLPRLQIADLAHVRLQQFLQAAEAGLQRRVHRAAGDGDAEAGRGEQRVLLGVDADADVIAFARWVLLRVRAAMTAAVRAVAHLRWRAVVAGAEDAALADDDGADAAAGATRARTHGQRDPHEVGVGVRPCSANATGALEAGSLSSQAEYADVARASLMSCLLQAVEREPDGADNLRVLARAPRAECAVVPAGSEAQPRGSARAGARPVLIATPPPKMIASGSRSAPMLATAIASSSCTCREPRRRAFVATRRGVEQIR